MGKRLQHEGSVYQRKDGRWTAQIVVAQRDGKPVRRYLYRDSAEAAREALTELRSQLDKGVLISPETITVEQYAHRWLEGIKPELKPRTVRSYEQLLRIHILPALGKKKVRDLRRPDVRTFLAAKREVVVTPRNAEKPGSESKRMAHRLSKNTLRLIRACLSAMYADAIEDGLAAVNPAQGLSRRHGRKRPDSMSTTDRMKAIRPFSELEILALLEAAKNDDYYALFLTLIRTGMRPGEAYALTWDDLDYGRREILVERALSPDGVSTTKTGGVRRVDMSNELSEALSRLYAERQRQKLKFGWPSIPPWVFATEEGKPLDESRVRKRFASVMRKAKLSGHKLYDCRHTFATLLLAKGAPITYVSAQLGHAKPSTTLQWYARWLPGSGKKYVDSLDSKSFEIAPKAEAEAVA